MKNPSLRAILATLLVVALLVTACGSASAPTPTTAPAAKTAEPSKSNAAPTAPAAASAGQTAPADSKSTTAPAAKTIIKVGYAAPFSGAAAFIGQDGQRGLELAMSKLNSASDGKFTYELVTADDQNTPAGGAAATRKLIDVDKVDVLIGPNSSGPALAAIPIVQEAKVPEILYAATSVEIAKVIGSGGSPYTWRQNIDDDIMGATWAKYIADQGIKKIATIGQNDDFGRGATAVYQREFGKLNVEVVSSEYSAVGQSDLRAQLTKMASGNPDAVLAFLQARDAVVMVRQMRELGLKARVFGRNTVVSKDFLSAAAGDNSLGEGIQECTIAHVEADPAYVAAYKARFNEDPVFTFNLATYTALMTINEAAKAGGAGRDGIQKGFPKVDFLSILGRIKFDEKNQAHHDLFINGITNGKIVLVSRQTTGN